MARIVIIDDEADLADLYQLALEGAGHQILGIYDNPEKLLAQTGDRVQPDVIILDERLRGRSGTTFLPRLRRRFPQARILFASADPDAVESSVVLCADAARKKPFALGELIEDVYHLIHSRAPLKKCGEAAV